MEICKGTHFDWSDIEKLKSRGKFKNCYFYQNVIYSKKAPLMYQNLKQITWEIYEAFSEYMKSNTSYYRKPVLFSFRSRTILNN